MKPASSKRKVLMNQLGFWPFFLVILTLGAVLTEGVGLAKEHKEISLGEIGTVSSLGTLSNVNPIIQFYNPPENTSDKFTLRSTGLAIEQTADSKGSLPWVAGFRTMAMMKGDFKVQLDMECKINEPSKGWGQGLLLAVALDDQSGTAFKIGRLAIPARGQVCQAELSGRRIEHPVYRPIPYELEKGSLVIERIGKRILFSIIDNGQSTEIGEIESPPANVRYVEVTCTRQWNGGNTEASYLLKKLHLETDAFFAFEQRPAARFSPWYLTVSLLILLALRLAYVSFWGKEK